MLGSEVYVVGFSQDDDAIVVSCTCPYFVDRGPCKHVWAAAVVIDQDPRWDGSWLEGGPLIDYDIGIDDPYYEADEIDAVGGPAFLPPSLTPSLPPRIPARKPRTKPDPVTEAAQAAVNRLAELRQQLMAGPAIAGGAPRQLRPIPPPDAQLIFILDAAATKATGMLMVHAATRKRAADGPPQEGPAETIETPEGTVAVDRSWSAAKPLTLSPPDVARIADKADRDLVALLTSAAQSAYYGYQGYGAYGESGPGPGYGGGYGYGGHAAPYDAGPFGHRHQPLAIPGAFHATALQALCDTGRAFLYTAEPGIAYHQLRWDPRPWTFRLEIVPDLEAPYPAYMLTGAFVRDTTRFGLNEPALILGSGFIVTTHTVSPLETPGGFWWAANLRRHGPMRIPREKADEVLAEVLSEPALPPLDVPDELRFDEPDVAPVPVLTLRPDPSRFDAYAGTLEFDYNGARVAQGTAADTIYRPSPRSLIRRKREVETAAEESLKAHRVRFIDMGPGRTHLSVSFKAAPAMVRDLLPLGWRIDVEGKPFRVSGDDGRRGDVGDRLVRHRGHGGFRRRAGAAARVAGGGAARRVDAGAAGQVHRRPHRRVGGAVRRALGVCWRRPRRGPPPRARVAARARRCPAGLARGRGVGRPRPRCAQPAARLRGDCGRRRSRRRLPAPCADTSGSASAGCASCRSSDLGGCLADDMGLGKTVTVLALIEARRVEKDGAPRASLVVAPRSLLFNWKREAERFAPALRVAEYHGSGRDEVLALLDGFDLVLTTYGTHEARCRGAGRRGVRLRGSRRGAGDQERGHGVGEGHAPPAGQASARAERHADREPAGRPVERVRVPEPGAARLTPARPARPRAQRRRGGARHAAARAAAVHPAAHEGAGGARASRAQRRHHGLRARACRAEALQPAPRSLPRRSCWALWTGRG